MVLESLGKSLNNALKRLLGSSVVDEDIVKEVVRDIQRALLQADVNVELVLNLSQSIEEHALKEELPPGIPRREHVVKVLYDALATFLGGTDGKSFPPGKNRPYIVMMVGIQGSGKTTTTAKLAQFHQRRGTRTAIVCADTYRLGAYEQLQQLAEKIGIPFYGDVDSKDAIKTAKKGLKQFVSTKYDLIIVDTAGRHKKETDLIKEMKGISKGVKPDEILLVIDGTLGQQAAEQATAFQAATPLGSIIVTKLDGTAKGGGALSAVAATGAPIRFIGTGERLDDLELFRPTRFVGRLLGMGDIESLIEKVKEAQTTPPKDAMMKLLTGKFSLDDFYDQMIALRKMGPLKKVLSMMGLGYQLPDDMQDMAEDQLDRFKSIIQSMTKKEKQDPKLINSSRARRIARGSGSHQKEVRTLVKQFENTRKTMKRLKKFRGKRGNKGMPNLQSLTGALDKKGKIRRR